MSAVTWPLSVITAVSCLLDIGKVSQKATGRHTRIFRHCSRKVTFYVLKPAVSMNPSNPVSYLIVTDNLDVSETTQCIAIGKQANYHLALCSIKCSIGPSALQAHR